jgi:hypothetical protein
MRIFKHQNLKLLVIVKSKEATTLASDGVNKWSQFDSLSFDFMLNHLKLDFALF